MLTKIKKLAYSAMLTASALVAPVAVMAQTEVVPGNIAPINNILVIIQAVVRFILIVAFVAAFIFLSVGGVRWILAGGDEKAVGAGRNTITAALIGLVIVLISFAIIRLVEIFFNLNIITGGVSIPNVVTP